MRTVEPVQSRRFLCLDIATAPIADASEYVLQAEAPANYKDPVKIEEYVKAETARRIDAAGLDLDLCRITAASVIQAGRDIPSVVPATQVAKTDDDERTLIAAVGVVLSQTHVVVTYGGFGFDLPVLERRARYLGLNFPAIDRDRYRSPHIDLLELLSDRDRSKRRPLNFYAKRLDLADLAIKPLDGVDEARVFDNGRWEDLAKSVERDVRVTYALGRWLDVIPAPAPATRRLHEV